MRLIRIVCLVGVLLLICGGAGVVSAEWDGTAIEPFVTGDGTAGSPYQIGNESMLAYFAQQINLGNGSVTSANVTVTASLNLGSHLWTPIGHSADKCFKGTFDGGGNTISGMNVTNLTATGTIYAGLFGYTNDAAITNVMLADAVVNVNTSDTAYAGGLVGYVKGGSVTNSCVASDVTATGSTASAGGLVGDISGSITNCYAVGNVTAASSSNDPNRPSAFAGGLVGDDHGGGILNCYAAGTVTATGLNTSSGGLVGDVLNDITIMNSAALTQWVNDSIDSTIGRVYGYSSNNNVTTTNTYAWRYMVFNVGRTVVSPLEDNGKNATNVSTAMIWGNSTFFGNLFGEPGLNGANWTMGTDPDYRLPILRSMSNPSGLDAAYLNKTFSINTTVTGSGGTITPPGQNSYADGSAVMLTLTPDSGFAVVTLTDNGQDVTVSITPDGTYIIPDVYQTHDIVVKYSGQGPVPPPAVDSSGNMDNAFRVLFDTKGGSFIQPVTGLSYGDRIREPVAPVKSGFVFAGWYRDDACTVAWVFDEDAVPGDITLYAKWIDADNPIPATREPVTTAICTPEPDPTTAPAAAAPSVQTVAATSSPLMQAPAPAAGMLAGLLAAGILLRRKE